MYGSRRGVCSWHNNPRSLTNPYDVYITFEEPSLLPKLSKLMSSVSSVGLNKDNMVMKKLITLVLTTDSPQIMNYMFKYPPFPSHTHTSNPIHQKSEIWFPISIYMSTPNVHNVSFKGQISVEKTSPTVQKDFSV